MAQPNETGPFPPEGPEKAATSVQGILAPWLGSGDALEPPVRPSPTAAKDYLDIAELVVREAAKWQNRWGVIIDPYLRFHAATSTPRFVGALGQLIGEGRCGDLLEACVQGYEHALACITDPAISPEFSVKELVFAHKALRGRVSAERLVRWEASWREYDGAAAYNAVRNNKDGNFNTFALLGEQARIEAGLGGGAGLVDRLIEKEMARFDANGMYQDPGCPLTYHIVVLQQWAMLLMLGYAGRHAAAVRNAVQRGGEATLLMQSAAGQAPAGGRSNQFHFVEAQSAALFEACARLAREDGEEVLAGAFKRAARRGVALVRPWFCEMRPFRHIKQGFHPRLNHGTDSAGPYGIYGILPASLLCMAARIADEGIPERLTPAERGGFVFVASPFFHQVFASCGGWSVQVDTKANLAKDATGLIRVYRVGMRPEAILAGGISARPDYSFAFALPQRNAAIGPQWRGAGGAERRLADFSEEIEDVQVSVFEENSQRVRFEIAYRGDLGGANMVCERYELAGEGLRYSAAVGPSACATSLEYAIPVIETDGDAHSTIEGGKDRLTVRYRGGLHTVAVRRGGVRLTDERNTNRNATYRTAVARPEGDGPLELAFS